MPCGARQRVFLSHEGLRLMNQAACLAAACDPWGPVPTGCSGKRGSGVCTHGALYGSTLGRSLFPCIKCPSLLSAHLNLTALLELVQGHLHQEACCDHWLLPGSSPGRCPAVSTSGGRGGVLSGVWGMRFLEQSRCVDGEDTAGKGRDPGSPGKGFWAEPGRRAGTSTPRAGGWQQVQADPATVGHVDAGRRNVGQE